VGSLYLVATPIGNLEDISARALRILRSVPLIAAEDTRHSAKLLRHYDIHTPLTSFHEHSQPGVQARLLAALETGDLALISDAGTPLLNDPGYELVQAALQSGHMVTSIPGPSALLAALVVSGLPTDSFLYLGYLPRRRVERRRLLAQVSALPYTMVFLETPHRLVNSLQDLLEVLGDRQAAVARELTKLHEEIRRGPLSQAFAHFQTTPPRGEFTLVVAGKPTEKTVWSEAELRAALEERLAQNSSPSQIASALAAESGWPRRTIYQMLTEMG
jgi:16S rRNA (cytidine1402-2'-O)-methyltransferase